MQTKIGYALDRMMIDYRERRAMARELRSLRPWIRHKHGTSRAIGVWVWATAVLGLKLESPEHRVYGGDSAAASLVTMLIARETPYKSRPRSVREVEEENPYTRPQIQEGLPGVIYSKEAIRKAHARIFSNTK